MRRKGGEYGSTAFARHARLREGISSAGSCLQCQPQGAGYVWKAGPAFVCVEEAFSVHLDERRTSPLACCQWLPALLEDGGRKRKSGWKFQPAEQTCSTEKLPSSPYPRHPPSYLCLWLRPIPVLFVLSEPCYYVRCHYGQVWYYWERN